MVIRWKAEITGEIIQGEAEFVPFMPFAITRQDVTLPGSFMEEAKRCDLEPTDMMIDVREVIVCEIGDTGPPPEITTTVTTTDANGQARFFLRLGNSQENIITRVSFRDQAVEFETIVAVGDIDIFRFQGMVDDVIQLTLLDHNRTESALAVPRAILFGPSQQPLGAEIGLNATGEALRLILEETGTHIILVTEMNHDHLLTYTIGLHCAPCNGENSTSRLLAGAKVRIGLQTSRNWPGRTRRYDDHGG